jgi:hypothetical protein
MLYLLKGSSTLLRNILWHLHLFSFYYFCEIFTTLGVHLQLMPLFSFQKCRLISLNTDLRYMYMDACVCVYVSCLWVFQLNNSNNNNNNREHVRYVW